jgi:hypothetical protein
VPAGTRNGRVRWAARLAASSPRACCWGRARRATACGGTLACSKVGFPPATLLPEYSLGTGGGGGADYFDVSPVHGFNAPMSFLPIGGGAAGAPGEGRRAPCRRSPSTARSSSAPRLSLSPGATIKCVMHCNKTQYI